MEVYDLSDENELETYMSREVPVPEGDEARRLMSRPGLDPVTLDIYDVYIVMIMVWS